MSGGRSLSLRCRKWNRTELRGKKYRAERKRMKWERRVRRLGLEDEKKILRSGKNLKFNTHFHMCRSSIRNSSSNSLVSECIARFSINKIDRFSSGSVYYFILFVNNSLRIISNPRNVLKLIWTKVETKPITILFRFRLWHSIRHEFRYVRFFAALDKQHLDNKPTHTFFTIWFSGQQPFTSTTEERESTRVIWISRLISLRKNCTTGAISGPALVFFNINF